MVSGHLIQGVPSQMILKELIYLSFCVQYFYYENCFEKVLLYHILLFILLLQFLYAKV